MLDLTSERELPVVLLIDDDLVSREVTATLLTLSGYMVHTAENGEVALKMLSEDACQPGVILCDAQLPGISGVELIGKLRGASKLASIYLISGSKPEESLASAADGVLLKPFGEEALRKLLAGEGTQGDASFLDSDEPVVSTEVLAKLRQMMTEDAVRAIFVAVVTDLERRVETLGAAIARHDRDEVRRIGHAIKGGCGMAGALQAARIGALLEAQQDNQLDNSPALLADLRTAVLGLQRILNDKLPA